MARKLCPCVRPHSARSPVPPGKLSALFCELTHQGSNLSDDSEIDEAFTVSSFSLGTTRIRDGALKFMQVSRVSYLHIVLF